LKKSNIGSIIDSYEVHFPEHVCVISFNGDYESFGFQDWLELQGFDQFEKWYKIRKIDYET
jgi:hypothetical protein